MHAPASHVLPPSRPTLRAVVIAIAKSKRQIARMPSISDRRAFLGALLTSAYVHVRPLLVLAVVHAWAPF